VGVAVGSGVGVDSGVAVGSGVAAASGVGVTVSSGVGVAVGRRTTKNCCRSDHTKRSRQPVEKNMGEPDLMGRLFANGNRIDRDPGTLHL